MQVQTAQAAHLAQVEASQPEAIAILQRLRAVHERAVAIGTALQACADRLTHGVDVGEGINAPPEPSPRPFESEVHALLDRIMTALTKVEKAGDQIHRFTGQ